MTFFQAFLDVLFLYGGQGVWGSSTPRNVLILEIQVFWRKKTKKSHNFSVLALFDIEDPILDSFRLDTVRRFEISGFDRYAIRYYQAWLQLHNPMMFYNFSQRRCKI